MLYPLYLKGIRTLAASISIHVPLQAQRLQYALTVQRSPLDQLRPRTERSRCHMVATRRILVVDDEPLVTKSCRRILSEAGHEVQTAQSGREGLRQALTQHFDLVMTDLKMPDLDGMDLVRAVRKDRPQTAIVIITGYGTIPSAVAATRLGVADYIEKPFTPEEIMEAVRRALPAGPPAPGLEADQVRAVLAQAAGDPSFGARVLAEGTRVLSGLPLSDRAKAAIVSGDIVWIQKECGELSPQERHWLQRRLEAEIW